MSNRSIRKLCGFFLVIYAFLHPIFGVILPFLFKTKLGYADTRYGQIQVAIVLGMLVGSLTVGLIKEGIPLKKPLWIGSILTLVAMIMFSIIVTPSSVRGLGNDTLSYLVLLGVALFLLSFSIMFIAIPVRTYIQKATPEVYMSRVFSIVSMISKGGMPLGALIYGVALNKVEIHLTVITTTIMMIIISIGLLTSMTRNQDI